MPPIKVLRIISRLNVGGPTIHVTLLTKLLAPPDYECWLVTGHIGKGDGDMNYYPVQQGVTPIYMDELGKAIRPMKDIVALWKLWRMMRRLKPDVVHTHTMKAGFLGRLAAWLAGVPVILFTAHGYGLEKYFTPLQTRIYHTLDRFAARISTRVIALTPSIRRELLEVHQLKDTDKVIVIKLGLDLERFVRQPRHQGEFRAAWNISTDAPLFAIVGRIVPIKNHTLFLQASAKVIQTLPNARFMIIGDGDLREQTEAQVIEFGLSEHVIFTGWIENLTPVYSDLDATVISSLSEGTPVALIEAMASGCPVVSTAVGGVPDLLEHGKLGKLAPIRDADALAQAMIEVIQSPPDSGALRRDIAERYSIQRLVHDLDTLYRQLLEQKRPDRA